jgi:hypothetical protein
MKNIQTIFVFLILLSFASCSETTTTILTPRKIVENAVKFNDPNNNWKSLHANFSFESAFKHNPFPVENLEIEINVPKNEFRYSNSERDFEAIYKKDTCETISKQGNCNNYAWTKDFYTYVWGLPMKLQDPQTNIISFFTIENINKHPCYKVGVKYPNEDFDFYFKCSNFELLAFSFSKNDSSGHSEFVELKGLYAFNNIKFPETRTWKDNNTQKTLGTNTVKKITSH